MAVASLSTQAVYAAPAAGRANGNAVFAKVKMVKFTLRNGSSEPLKLKIGDSEVTLQPNKPMDVKVACGQSITTTEATPSHAAGTILATAAVDLDGTTVTVR